MSHSVTITRTTTTASSTGVVSNTGYLKTLPGLLRLGQLILGAVCVGIVGYYINRYYVTAYSTKSVLFFFTMAITFMIGTFCILLSCLINFSTGPVISKTIYDCVYHSIACILYFAASIALLVEATSYKYLQTYEAYMAASIIGLIVSVLYLLSTAIAAKAYRGL